MSCIKKFKVMSFDEFIWKISQFQNVSITKDTHPKIKRMMMSYYNRAQGMGFRFYEPQWVGGLNFKAVSTVSLPSSIARNILMGIPTKFEA
jgi:hypothetical protein